ncbi:unnamed protein product [Tetraodon nigroviridis]|uniref:FERM, ARHGEF and pleckstrin domain-containing protein 2 n=2 Tax=Tetraodon nigroviridis TaxID=99883 RepID=Q4T982_TETNG|nr:unnamed protein product [Tetraodon nigroviridis]
MGDIEGSYRVLQTPGTRLGAQFNAGISTLEPGQSLAGNMISSHRNFGRTLQIRVHGLDDSQEFFDMDPKALGQSLLSEVFFRGNLIESDYFGLEFQNILMNWVCKEAFVFTHTHTHTCTFIFEKTCMDKIATSSSHSSALFHRYLFSLQMKRDLMEGRLICTENTGALLVSHLVQAEMGDYDDVADRDFLRMHKFLPYQEKVQERIMELHCRHQGQTPAESDFQILEIARKLEMYGVRFHPAADREGTKINLSVSHMGLQVFQGHTKINTFNWSKIRKLSFKRKWFLIKLHPEVHGPHQDTLEFLMASRDQCKIFWKICVEYHSFFRLFDQPQPKTKAILSLGAPPSDIVKAAPPSHFTFQGAPSSQAVGHCSPMFACLESSSSLSQPSKNGNEDTLNQRRGAEAVVGGSGLKRKGPFTPEAFQVELLRTKQNPMFSMSSSPVHVTEEFIDDDPTEMSFYGGGAEAFPFRVEDKVFDYVEESDLGKNRLFSVGIEDLNRSTRRFPDGMVGHSESSSLVNNRSECSSLDNLGLSSAGESMSVGYGGNDSSSLRLPGSGIQSEASSMLNFPACSVRSESSSAVQFSDLMSNLSLSGQAPSPLQSPILSEVGNNVRLEEEEEGRRKRYPTDKAYFIAKEILTTERTYLKDLEVITVWFRSAVIKENAMPEGLMTLLFSNIDPIYEFHRDFFKELDQRLALWEGRSNAHVKGDCQRIGDVMLRNMCALKEFTSYLQKHDEVLTELEKATKRMKKLETVYKEFELQKVCYLPLNTFLLKPIQRLMHYKLILERLCKHYSPTHRDHDDCKEALKEVADIAAQLQSSLIRLENFQKLTELQRDLIGIENLTAPGRKFIREGCLYKLTKKGLQQRMFFLFSDMLLYTSKGVTATNQFKVHGQLPLHGMILIVLDAPVEESENEWSVPHCFTIYSAQRTVVVAASSKVEMGKWIEDLNMAIDMARTSQEKSSVFLDGGLGDHSNRSSDEVSVEQESEEDINSSRTSLDKQAHHRANTTIHVCWHRNTSVSMSDHSLAVENQLSGYLLRKFKNSNGWQKLWVVFTNFCLFFYKTHQDDFPLASLPLLGYTVGTPEESDSIHKEYVFKLQFKSHVYFFRAESEYTFER